MKIFQGIHGETVAYGKDACRLLCRYGNACRDCGVKWFGRRIYDISGLLHEGENTLEVKVTTLLGNYVQTLKDEPVAQRFLFRRNNPLVPAGLIGPVILY